MEQESKFIVDPRWRTLLTELGLAPAEVLAAAQLPLDLFEDKATYITTPEFLRLWDAAEKAFSGTAFSLKVMQSLSVECFSPPAYAALCSPNFIIAMERLSLFKRLTGPVKMCVNKGSQEINLSYETIDFTYPLPPSVAISQCVCQTLMARMGTRKHIEPLKVTTTEAIDDLEEYAEFFGVTPELSTTNSIVFSAKDAQLPFLTANEIVWRAFEPELRQALVDIDADQSFASKVRTVLLEVLPCGQHSMEEVGKRLAMSKRTLQRRLRGEGTSFQTELQEVREKLARHYLKSTELPSVQIALLLGYDDPNSFYRAFARWTGKSPEQYRSFPLEVVGGG